MLRSVLANEVSRSIARLPLLINSFTRHCVVLTLRAAMRVYWRSLLAGVHTVSLARLHGFMRWSSSRWRHARVATEARLAHLKQVLRVRHHLLSSSGLKIRVHHERRIPLHHLQIHDGSRILQYLRLATRLIIPLGVLSFLRVRVRSHQLPQLHLLLDKQIEVILALVDHVLVLEHDQLLFMDFFELLRYLD